MGQIALTLPTAGQTLNSTADPELISALQTIQTAINGGLDATNISAALAQAAAVNQAGTQTVKGSVTIATSETRNNTAYGLLPTADQVQSVVLGAGGLILVWYQALWQESVAGAGRAAIFIGPTQLKIQPANAVASPWPEAAATNSGTAAVWTPLFTCPVGLASCALSTSANPDVTTGQVVGFSDSPAFVLNEGTPRSMNNGGGFGGLCSIFAAAGTYTVSVQYRATSGTVTAQNRKLWVQALSFA